MAEMQCAGAWLPGLCVARLARRVWVLALLAVLPLAAHGQINTDRVMLMGRNALYYEDYVLSIQRFNMVINARPYLSEPYFYRGLAKFYLEDFAGAETDCSTSLELNPYVSMTYQLRALCRINRKDYEGAIADYEKVLDQEPKNQSCWHNLVLCRFELKQYDKAIETIDRMIRLWPRSAENYTMKAQAAIQQADTVRGLELIDSALVCDAFDTRAWSMRSMISLSRGQYAQAEAEVDKAIVQSPRTAGYYVNRALARFHQNNLRGAMADYDQALEIDPRNYLAHFNRALMLDNTGDYRGAIRDITAVIDEYPEFWTGYAQRAAIRRKIGDVYGAERDEFKILKARMDRRSGNQAQRHKTRKQSSRNIEDYASLVEADTSEPEPEYASAYRGKVQNRQVELTPQPLYVLSYHRSESAVSRYLPYYKAVESLNASHVLPRAVYLTNHEPTLTESQMQVHFDAIADATQRIEAAVAGRQDKKRIAILYFGRALDEYQVRDFDSAARDLDSAAQLDADAVLVQMLLAQVRQRQMEVQTSEADAASLTTRLGASAATDALRRLTKLAPDMPYAWYNLGNLYLSLKDYGQARDAYTRALNADPRFPAAYYNRGLAAILDGNLQSGLSDLSQAGEYGLYQAYNLIKRYSKP